MERTEWAAPVADDAADAQPTEDADTLETLEDAVPRWLAGSPQRCVTDAATAMAARHDALDGLALDESSEDESFRDAAAAARATQAQAAERFLGAVVRSARGVSRLFVAHSTRLELSFEKTSGCSLSLSLSRLF